MSGSSNGEPLEELYEDKDQFDRERLASALLGIISIDQDSGEPIFKAGYSKLNNEQKFVAQLMYRRAAESLGDLDEGSLGASSEELAENIDVSSRSVRNYGSKIAFIRRDEHLGGYYLPGYALEEAIEFISET